MLNEHTEFKGNAIGIDPAGCGCMECLTGSSIPEDSPYMQELLQAHFNEGREILNRSNGSLAIYRSRSGEYRFESISSNELKSLPETGHRWASDESGKILHDNGCSCDDCESGLTIPIDAGERLEEFLDGFLNDSIELINNTHGYLVIFRTWDGSVSVSEYDVASESDITVLPEW